MKLRLDKKTVKIRVSKEEITKFRELGYLEESLFISESNHFTYAMKIANGREACHLKIRENELLIEIPPVKSEKWVNSNQIGIKETFDTENGESITIFVEEDLPPRKKK